MNWYDGWGGYMVLMRSVYSKLFPDLDKILSLDLDTIVTEDISELWELDMSNYFVAGVRDTPEFNKNGLYVNGGVLFYNLNKIKERKKDELMIYRINHYKKDYAE
jgi:lipopolysaccharide biosynthesis glycosyltransferase